MELSVTKILPGAKLKEKTLIDPLQEIIKEAREVEFEMQCVRGKFDFTTNEELLDSYIFQLKSLEARYSYVLARAKLIKENRNE